MPQNRTVVCVFVDAFGPGFCAPTFPTISLCVMTNRHWFCLAICLTAIRPVVAGAAAASDRPACRLANIQIVKGMPRLSVEQQVQNALGLKVTYSPFANNLAGGTVNYDDDGCTLIVSYASGAPAPITRTTDGKTEHLPPRDEEVLAVELVRSDERRSGKPQ